MCDWQVDVYLYSYSMLCIYICSAKTMERSGSTLVSAEYSIK